MAAQAGYERDKQRAELDAAMSLAYSAWGSGLWGSVERTFSWMVSPGWRQPADQADFAKKAEPHAAMLREILQANEKDWAKNRDEFALHPVVEGGKVARCGLVLIERRRILGPGAIVSDPKEIPDRFRACNGFITSTGMRDRGPVAAWLHEAGMLRHGVLAIGVPHEPGEDFRAVLSGSHWLRSRVKPKDEVAKALLVAMQARSFHKDAIKVARIDWWQGMAAADMALTSGMPPDEACRQMDISWPQHKERILKEIAWRTSRMPSQPKPMVPTLDDGGTRQGAVGATDKQREFAKSLVERMPQLSPLFPQGWDADGRQASRAISAALACESLIKPLAQDFDRAVRKIVSDAADSL